MFKENLNRMCKKKGTTLTKMLKDLGYSSSKTTAINNGQLPKEETLIEMAHYLGCSVMDFFDEPTVTIQPLMTIKAPVAYSRKKGNRERAVRHNTVSVQLKSSQDFTDDEKDLIRIYREADRRGKHEIMAMIFNFEGKKNESSDLRKVFEPRTEG